jgi:hypothetical protein
MIEKINEIIQNKAIGDRIEFLQTDQRTSGKMSNFIMTLSPHSS